MTTEPDGPPPSTGYLLWHLTQRWRAALDRALAPIGLTPAQYALLASLYALTRSGSQPSQRQLADFSGLEPMYVSKLARLSERDGLLARAENPADPRAVQVSLTERGIEAVRAGVAIVRALEEKRLAPLGGAASEQSAAFRSTLQALLRHARATEQGGSDPTCEAGDPASPDRAGGAAGRRPETVPGDGRDR